MTYRALGLMAGMLLAATTLVPAQELPRAVALYEQRKAALPRSTFDLNLCRLLAHPEPSFYSTPKDREPMDCDLSHVVLKYGGWCAAGIEDKAGPHFSECYMARITIERVGGWTMVSCNHYSKSFAHPDAEDIAAAEHALETVPPSFVTDIRQPTGRDLFLGNGDATKLTKRQP